MKSQNFNINTTTTKRNNPIVIVVIIIAATVALLVGGKLLYDELLKGKEDTPSTVAVSPTPGSYENVTVTTNSVIIGNPNAEQTVTIYQDFACPFCRDFHNGTDEQFNKWVEAGNLKVEYVVFNKLGGKSGNTYSNEAANLFAYVADTQPWLADKVASKLYALQPNVSNLKGPGLDAILDAVKEVGVEIDEADLPNIEDRAYLDWVTKITKDAADAGVGSVPAIYINGAPATTPTVQGVIAEIEDLLN